MSQSVDKPAVAAPAPSFSRANFVWTDCAVKLLINAAHKHEAYKKTSMKIDQKWELVRAELVLQPTCHCAKFTPEGQQIQGGGQREVRI